MIKTIHPQLCCVVINPIPLLINFTSFAQLQIKDKLRTYPRREGFTRNKGKISSLICFYLLYPIPYALPRLGRRVFSALGMPLDLNPQNALDTPRV